MTLLPVVQGLEPRALRRWKGAPRPVGEGRALVVSRFPCPAPAARGCEPTAGAVDLTLRYSSSASHSDWSAQAIQCRA